MARHANQGGFTLLEAITAMVIMATAMLALYSWLSASTFSLNRAKAQTEAVDDFRTGLALIQGVNPMQEPNGEIEAGPLTVRWNAHPVAERRNGLSPAGYPTQFDLALYQLDVEVLREGGKPRTFRMRKAGWHVARPVSMDDE